MMGESSGDQATAVQQGAFSGFKLSRKRSAEDHSEEPAAKRWQIESFPGAMAGSVSKKNGVWDAASAARTSEGGSSSTETGQEGDDAAEGLTGLPNKHNNLRVKVALSNAAMSQQPEKMDESGDV